MRQLLIALSLVLLISTVAPAKIVFDSKRDGNRDIYVMNDSGTQIERLTSNPRRDYNPRWSPDGKHIVFRRNMDPAKGRVGKSLFIMNADGNNVRQLTHHEGSDGYFSFSPDGKSIVFERIIENKVGIYVMNLESGRVKRLEINRVAGPDWSPDGKQIAYEKGEHGGKNVWIMTANGGNQRPLRPMPPVPAGNEFFRQMPKWSPDGKQILYSESEFKTDQRPLPNGVLIVSIPLAYRIMICDSNGNNPRQLKIPTDWLHNSLAWMDDGESILFTADADFDIEEALKEPHGKHRNFEVYKYHIRSGQITQLTNHPDDDLKADWISDDVLSVSPAGKAKTIWGKIKTSRPVSPLPESD
jgi:Tol biopolymer transport system component